MTRTLGWIGILLPWSSLVCLLWFEGIPEFSLSLRQAWLLLGSLAASALVGALAAAMGGGAALYTMIRPKRRIRIVAPLLALGAALPPIITASALLTFFGQVSPSLSQGWMPSVMVQSLTLSPLAGLILLLALNSISGDELDSASVFLSEGRSFVQVLLPLCRPGLLAAFAASASLALLDFTVPTLFGLTTSMVEVYSDLTAGRSALSSALPHFIAVLPGVVLLGAWIAFGPGACRADQRPARNLPLPGGIRFFSGAAALGLGLCSAFLAALLSWQGLVNPNAFRSAYESLPDLGSSLVLAALASMAVLPFAAVCGRSLASSQNPWAWIAAAAPIGIPPALVGSATAQAAVAWDLGGMAPPVLAHLLRFLPIATLISALWWGRMSRDLENASVILLPPMKRFFLASLPTAAPLLGTLLMVVFTLSLGELGATLLVLPPGESTLTLRLYNFLHYGSAPDSALMTLLLLAAAALPVGLLSVVARTHHA